MSVWCNRWYNEGFTALVLITGWEFFCIKIQKGTGHVSIRDVVKLKNTTSPNKKDSERETAYRPRVDSCYQGYDSEIPYNERVHGT